MRSAAHPVLSLPRVVAWLTTSFLVLPLLVVIPVSFTPERYLSFPRTAWSLRHYEALLAGRWLSSLGDSLLVACFASLLALVLGSAFAIGLWRLAGPVPRALRLLALGPMIVPAIVHAVAFYRAWARLGLLDTYLGLVLVHGMKGMPFVLLSVSASIANLDPRIEQAARSLGASPFVAVWRAVLPNLKPGLVAGAVFAFVTSWDEIIVALFITSRAVYTLPRRIWDGLFDNVDPAIAALASILVTVTAAALLARRPPRGAGTRGAAERG